MLIKADNEEEAALIVQKRYNYPVNYIKIKVVKEPSKVMGGLFKIKGKYKAIIQIPLKKPVIEKADTSYKNGCVKIKDGFLSVFDPIDDGRYPSIIAKDPNIKVYINNEKREGSLVVTSKDKVKFKFINIEPILNISVEILNHKMAAILTIEKQSGKEFFLEDAKKDISIKIRSGFKEIKPKDISIDDCIQKIKAAGVKSDFIDTKAIGELLSLDTGGSMIVAKGVKPIEGEGPKIKYFFDHRPQSISDLIIDTEFDLKSEPIVQIGDVLAIKRAPATQGIYGYNIVGELIKPKEIKDIPLQPGEGATILDNGTKAIATVSGRPMVANGAINVIPLLIIPGDLNKTTGDIDFDGDIIIKGNIMDNMKVFAEGDLKVFGSVYNSKIVTNGNIDILGRVIGGKLRAGIGLVEYYCVAAQMKLICKAIKELLDYIETSDKADNIGFQRLLISDRALIVKCSKKVDRVLHLLEDADSKKIIELLKQIKSLIIRFSKLYKNDISRVQSVYEKLMEYVDSINLQFSKDVRISLDYAQTSTIEACGSIIIKGSGSYISNLFAKDRIIYEKLSSNAKGGLLIAGKSIKAGTLGSKTGIRTYCKVLEKDGKVDAFFNDGTIVTVNDKTKVINVGDGTDFFDF